MKICKRFVSLSQLEDCKGFQKDIQAVILKNHHHIFIILFSFHSLLTVFIIDILSVHEMTLTSSRDLFQGYSRGQCDGNNNEKPKFSCHSCAWSV